jgi:hypothetical protein
VSFAALDDKFHSHPKVLIAGNAAAGLYARSLAYCADQLTDGFVPEAWASSCGSRAEIASLLASKLWRKRRGGFVLPDYLEFNPSRADVLQKRVSAAERKRRSRSRHTPVTRDTAVTHAGSDSPSPNNGASPDGAAPTRRDLVAHFVDETRRVVRRDPLDNAKARMGRHVKALREQGVADDLIAAAITETVEAGLNVGAVLSVADQLHRGGYRGRNGASPNGRGGGMSAAEIAAMAEAAA